MPICVLDDVLVAEVIITPEPDIVKLDFSEMTRFFFDSVPRSKISHLRSLSSMERIGQL